jgi:hypothetical protein
MANDGGWPESQIVSWGIAEQMKPVSEHFIQYGGLGVMSVPDAAACSPIF